MAVDTVLSLGVPWRRRAVCAGALLSVSEPTAQVREGVDRERREEGVTRPQPPKRAPCTSGTRHFALVALSWAQRRQPAIQQRTCPSDWVRSAVAVGPPLLARASRRGVRCRKDISKRESGALARHQLHLVSLSNQSSGTQNPPDSSRHWALGFPRECTCNNPPHMHRCRKQWSVFLVGSRAAASSLFLPHRISIPF